MGWLADFAEYCRREMLSDGPGLVFCGDFNICHREEDIHDPKGLSETSGFLPSERDWFTGWLGIGLTDTFRALNPGAVQYSWWSQRSRARQNNKGWRIDYVATCPRVAPRVKRSWIDASPVCSDHCPSLVELSD
jgi:exodeoxyribonuclease-3